MELVFLGTGAGGGVPSFYCGCKACKEAAREPRYRRTRCAVSLTGEDNVLIDTPPELASQLLREGIENISYLLLTHAHYDHVGGLGDLEYYVRLSRKRPLTTMMTGETWAQLEPGYGFMVDCLDVTLIDAGQVTEIGKLRLTALPASHMQGTVGFLIENGKKRVAYLPDTGPLPAATMDLLDGIECLVLDATFWGNNSYPGEHLSFDEALAVGKELGAQQLYLTHLAMHYSSPVTNGELEKALEPYGQRVHLAYDGLRLAL